jgi:hypothetical protein
MLSSNRRGSQMSFVLQELVNLLKEPTTAELASFSVPPLPAPPEDVHADFAACTQWRLHRIWRLLHFPALLKMDMLLQLMQIGASEGTEGTLGAWEAVAAAVTAREAALFDLVKVRPCYPCSAYLQLICFLLAHLLWDDMPSNCRWDSTGLELWLCCCFSTSCGSIVSRTSGWWLVAG